MSPASTKSINIEQAINECDDLIRKGQISEATNALRQIEIKKIPDRLRARVANLCRRVRLAHVGLTVLRPIVRPSRLSPRKQPSSKDVAEYALLLEKIGAVPEALFLINSIMPSKDPELLFAKAACHINQWNYEAAEPLLKECASTASNPYQQLIAKVNWAATLTELRKFDEAFSVLDECIKEASENNHQRLKANCLEIRAQIYIAHKEFNKARLDLQSSLNILGIAPTLEPLHIRKWIALIDAFEKQSIAPLEYFKQEAAKANDLSSVRDTELNILKITKDEKKLDFLYAGTPLQGFRRHIERELEQEITKTDFVIAFGNTDDQSPTLDLLASEFQSKNKVYDLAPGRITYRLFEILLKDFYGTSSIGSLFSELFTEEYYNVKTSPERIRQVIYRTRKWLKDHELPFAIHEVDSCYKILIEKPLFLKIAFRNMSSDPYLSLVNRFKNTFNDQLFSAKEAQIKIQLSYGSWHRFSSWATANGYLVVSKQNKKTFYKVSQK